MKKINLNDPADLRRLIVILTDGVYNTSDTAAFGERDIAIINEIRNFKD